MVLKCCKILFLATISFSFCLLSCSSDFGRGKEALASGDKQGALVYLKKVVNDNSHYAEAQQLIKQTEDILEQERLQREKEQKENSLKESLRSAVRATKSSSWGEPPDIGSANIENVDGTDKYVGYVIVNATESNYFTGMPQKVRYYEVWSYNTKSSNDWSFEKQVSAGDAATESVSSVVAEAKAALAASQNSSKKAYSRSDFSELITGKSQDEVISILGEPYHKVSGLFVYCFSSSSDWFTHSSNSDELIKDKDKGVKIYFDESSKKVSSIDYIYSEIDHMCD